MLIGVGIVVGLLGGLLSLLGWVEDGVELCDGGLEIVKHDFIALHVEYLYL